MTLNRLALSFFLAGLMATSAHSETADQAATKALEGFGKIVRDGGDPTGTIIESPLELVKKARALSFNLEEDSEDVLVRWERSRWLEGSIGRVGILDIELTGFADDSVAGERKRYVMHLVEGGYKIIAAGRQNKCWRGQYKNKWTKELCS